MAIVFDNTCFALAALFASSKAAKQLVAQKQRKKYTMVWVAKYDAASATTTSTPFNPFNKLNHHKCIACEHAFAQDEIIIGYNGSLLNQTRGGLAHLACFKPRFAPHITMFGSSMDELSNTEQNTVKEQIHTWQEENKKKRMFAMNDFMFLQASHHQPKRLANASENQKMTMMTMQLQVIRKNQVNK